MMNSKFPRRAAGFSLIDAMIAVVVLATGILALTFLQVTMLRAASEARERSVAMNLAQNIIEERRSTGAQAQANYVALDDQGVVSGGACDYADASAIAAPGSVGLPTAYRYCVDVQRFRASGATFAAVPVSGAGAPTYSAVIPEFKQIIVDIGWQRTDGTWGNLRLGDALSGVQLINANDLTNRPFDSGTVQPPPRVYYSEGELTANTNFIPIAVGDGTGAQIGATNPTPKVIGGGVAETSFQVFTYSANAGLANVQRQIDTRVIGCKCTSRAAPALLAPEETTTAETFLTRPVRASFWDGGRYTEPKPATYATTDLIGTEQAAAVGLQSPLCDVCCRDHHDPSSVAYGGTSSSTEGDDVPKFDPYRAVHSHYIDPSADADENKVSAAGDNYEEVCRVIRVSGIYRVSQDPLLDHFAYIPTDNNAVNFATTSALPGYQRFVQDYVEDRVLPLAGYDWATNRVDVPALEGTHGLNSQAAGAIDINESDRRYLQNRSILLDVLGYQAKTALQACIDLTGMGSPSDLACALRHTAFASINLTELSRWSVVRESGPTDPIRIQPKNFSVTTPTGAPVAGQVFDASGAVPNSVADALAAITRSIATLADRLPTFYRAVSDTLWPASDSQPFRYVGGVRPSLKIEINVAGLTYFSAATGDSFAPYIGWSNPTAGTQGDCTRITGTLRFTCDLYNLTNAANVNIRMFNYHQQLAPTNNGAVCGSGSTRVRVDLPRCNLFRPLTFSGTTPAFTPPNFRTATTAGKPRDDEATASLGTVVDGGAYTVTFQASTNNPFNASFSCDALTGQPVLSFQDQECRR